MSNMAWTAPLMGMMAALLLGCGFAPLMRTYVLGEPSGRVEGVRSESNLAVIELKTVSVPDYLDSTDILRRVGLNEISASPTGRWGERLSLGVTGALASALSRRLPDLAVTTSPAARSSRRIAVDVEALDIDAAGQCRMVVRWRISAEGLSRSGHGTFSGAADAADDGAVAAALTVMIGQLADRIAATLDHE